MIHEELSASREKQILSEEFSGEESSGEELSERRTIQAKNHPGEECSGEESSGEECSGEECSANRHYYYSNRVENMIKVTDCTELENLAEFYIFIWSTKPGGDEEI
jgi:hypothetical protein